MAYSNNYRYYSVKIRGMILQVEPKQYVYSVYYSVLPITIVLTHRGYFSHLVFMAYTPIPQLDMGLNQPWILSGKSTSKIIQVAFLPTNFSGQISHFCWSLVTLAWWMTSVA